MNLPSARNKTELNLHSKIAIFLISPALLDTKTAWIVEIAYNGGHLVMTYFPVRNN